MLKSMRSFLGRKSRAEVPAEAETQATQDMPLPEHQTYIIGDVHGRADLLELMLELIDAHIGGTSAADPKLVFVGDYIDLGPDSAVVLARMKELQESFPDNVTCLMGSHERMMLDFLADPATRGPRWLRSGAVETLRSFGIATADLEESPEFDAYPIAAATLRRRLPSDTLKWLENLPLSWTSGNLWAVHAGADPGHAMDDQSARVLLWGHPEFDGGPRGDDIWIAHGHTEIDAPVVSEGRIGTDTGAWRTGRLTACAVRTNGRYDFLQT
ncbi:serine/threonine protein phosphatase [Rhodobacteraceae bacterium N5(2021)]|uniref:Serine/threonine protein phosphatase n=1 Tax=Gymnodinialimonas phycosphaerae TaxID=2841589 RepID=A0A975TSQ4_9RHOB|nr:metallophosphoesterase [Gymnodinialimonas phycosphaerae]MBY4893470.1 serine/threonine protein phosphatase [Gymnodinialimonas phycosphaerae]